MSKDFVLLASEVIMVISAIAILVSPFLFRSGGLIWGSITRKGILVMSVCLGIFVFTLWIAISIENVSQSLTALICLGGVSIIPGIYFIYLYLHQPRDIQNKHRLRREFQKYLGRKDEGRENLHKDKDESEQ